MRYSIGVDPGLGETGVVLCKDDDDLTPIAWATFNSPTGHSTLARAMALGTEVVSQILAWVHEYGIKKLDIAIELPIYSYNANSYEKQIRLLQEIESGIFYMVAGVCEECWVTEINPRQSKLLATGNGNANKDEVIVCSPFKDYKEFSPSIKKPTVEALADAWAHANATWEGQQGAPRINWVKASAAPINYIHSGRVK